MGQVLAVISGKGGTGKTSVCAGVAGCLCMEGARVLCIDADLGLRNLDISLGMASEAGLTFLDVMRGDYTLEQAPRAAGLSGLQLLTAPVSVCAEDLDGAQFASLIDEARRRYDWVLLDAPAGIGAGFDLAVRHADELMVVCLADPASQRDAARAAELALTKREVPAKLVVNRVSPQLFRRMNATVDDIMDGVGLPLLGIVPDDANVTLAAVEGKPLCQYTFQGASLACLHIAKRLQGKRVKLMKIRRTLSGM